MFLHEPGEENDSFTRQDLSMMNSIQTQQPSQSPSNAAPPPHRGPPIAAAAPMNRQESSDAPSPTGDTPLLPATANWGSKAAQERRASRSTTASNPSPMVSNAVPAPVAKLVKSEEIPKNRGGKGKEKEKTKDDKKKEKEKLAQTSASSTPQPAPIARPTKARVPGLEYILKTISNPPFRFCFSTDILSADDLKAIHEFPALIEPNGGAKRRAMKEKESEQQAQREAEQAATHAAAVVEAEESAETTAGGSLQLGGEPEERPEAAPSRHAIAPPGQSNLGASLFGQSDDFSSRGLTPQQQQQLLSFKTAGPQSASLQTNFSNSNTLPQNYTQSSNAPGHARHASRFSFANDSASASASVQPVANQKLMSQQSSMMPKGSTQYNQLTQHQPLGGQFYTSGVQGPPPGLKATGTPPVSGGGMFGQGHGFATGGMTYGANAAGRTNNDAMYQELLRARNMDGGARVADAGKRESQFPSFLHQYPTTSTPAPTSGLLSFPYGPSPGAYQESGSQKSKKKGKKHRQANTSSSGGGGVVDMQDPSILQARLHQGGGMVSQGLYPVGQGQGGFSSIYANNNNYGGGAGRW